MREDCHPEPRVHKCLKVLKHPAFRSEPKYLLCRPAAALLANNNNNNNNKEAVCVRLCRNTIRIVRSLLEGEEKKKAVCSERLK